MIALPVDAGLRSAPLPNENRIIVYEDGRIFRRINIGHPERSQWLQYKVQLDKDGYHYVRLLNKKWMVHRLVYSLFVGELVDGLVVCHRDGDKGSNRGSNLLQDTQAVTISHKRDHGTWQIGDKHPRSIYSEKIVGQVIDLVGTIPRSKTGRAQRGSVGFIADKMQVSRHLVYAVIRGKRHV